MTIRASAARTGLFGFLLLSLCTGAVAAPAKKKKADAGTVPVTETQPADASANPPAASEERTELDTMEVTGSRIKRTDYETAQPVLSIGRQDIERTGLTSIGDLLQKLPTAGSALNTAVNNGGNGSVEVDLRNLGSQRVLVLVNGRRWVNGLNAGSSSSVDLNTIPISIIERVEVLKDGASAVYGSDAIAGVVNIITRKSFQGFELRSQAGQFLQGDGLSQQHSLSIGSVAGDTSVFTDLSYTHQEKVMAGDRDISRLPTYRTGLTRGSSRTPQGRFVFTPDPSNATLPCAADGRCNLTLKQGENGADQSDFRNFVSATDRYNFAPVNYLLTPNERVSIFSALSHQFSRGVAFQGELLYNQRKSEQQLAPTPIDIGNEASPPFNTMYVSADNPYNPFGQDIGRSSDPAAPLPPPAGDAAGELPVVGPNFVGGVGSGVIFRRMKELGPRVFSQHVDTSRVGGGLNGDFDALSRLFTWNVGFTWAESRNAQRETGLVNIDRLRLGVGPLADCEATPGCVPVNVFGGQGVNGRGSMTPEMLRYIGYTGQGSTEQRMRHFYGYLSHDLFALPAGIVSAAYGAEYRIEAFADTPDPLVQSGASSTNRSLPTRGSYNVKEAYVEMQVPVLRDLPLVRTLDLTPAVRYSQYNVFGSSTNYKIGLRWKPVDDVLVRGTVSTAFRAPSISDLYLGLSDSFPGAADPCSDYTGASSGTPASPEVQANCTDTANPANGGAEVPDTYEQPNGQLLERRGGNPKLTPEDAKTYTAGIVWNPSFLPDFNAYVDWYRIDLTNAITTLGSQTILDECYRKQPRGDTCSLITRNPGTGNIDQIVNQNVNIGAINVKGVDVSGDYRLPWHALGDLKLVLDTTYLLEYTRTVTRSEGLQGQNRGDLGQAFPRFKANLTFNWSRGNWEAAWMTRFVGHQTEVCDDGAGPSLKTLGRCSDPNNPNGPRNELDDTFYNDVQLSWHMPTWDVHLTGGVKNVLDQDPPVSYSAFANSYDNSLYEVPGVFPYLRLAKSF
ncbi:MAG TPA: TonB-dependent receptor [Candidatus Binatia bacterium]|nr:TonB-dependent receptor [Candidatus Binatia bacterium]